MTSCTKLSPAPLITTSVPNRPEVGEKPLMRGGGITVKSVEDVPVPSEFVTVIGPLADVMAVRALPGLSGAGVYLVTRDERHWFVRKAAHRLPQAAGGRDPGHFVVQIFMDALSRKIKDSRPRRERPRWP